MDNETTARASRRWEALEFDADGKYWTARLSGRLSGREIAAGLESVVYGPDADACVREAARQDRMWAEFPLRADDRDGARRRLHYLAGGAV
ncbi:hypothetical protein [Actinomadura latina]|uniref:Uncharacterized protein n=1 Tax=Actinomadura latina TaxID=163603 RepID=A0A846Z8G3_9ACTN|nr:hypothetical protein [Actinomadura latina]NKZ08067.1 hypothetical protein [Actinomadura latina]